MKSLKPTQQNSELLAPRSIIDGLQLQVNQLVNAIENLQSQINDLSSDISGETIAKESGHFLNVDVDNQVKTKTLDADNITAANIDATILDAVTADFGSVNATTSTVTNETVNALTADTATVTDLTANEVTSTDVTAVNTETQSLSVTGTADIETANVGTLNVTSFSIPSLNALTKVESAEVDATDINATNVDATNIEADNASITGLTVDQLYNSKKLFDSSKFITTETLNEDPYYIKIPHFTSGTYRVELKDENDVRLFSVVVINSIDAPLVTYTKTTEAALTKINYDTEAKDIYLESYTAGKLYWSADTNDQNNSPETYGVMPVTTDTEYLTSAMKRVVVLGNETAYYGMDILGSLKASIFVDKAEEGTPLFYSGDTAGLISHLNTYLSSEDNEPHSISVAGYMRDNDTGIEYSIQTISRDSENKLWALVETSDGVGTDKVQLTPVLDATFGLFTDTYQWDQNING